jgi:hypothetical protein
MYVTDIGRAEEIGRAHGLRFGDREQRQTGNPGQEPQSPGVRTGTNPAEATKTATTNTSTLGRSIDPE